MTHLEGHDLKSSGSWVGRLEIGTRRMRLEAVLCFHRSPVADKVTFSLLLGSKSDFLFPEARSFLDSYTGPALEKVVVHGIHHYRTRWTALERSLRTPAREDWIGIQKWSWQAWLLSIYQHDEVLWIQTCTRLCTNYVFWWGDLAWWN